MAGDWLGLALEWHLIEDVLSDASFVETLRSVPIEVLFPC